MKNGTILIISDIHTRFQVINQQVVHAQTAGGHDIRQVFVLGDFGFFQDKLRDYFRRQGNSFIRPVACIEGNHEDHGRVTALAAEYADVFTYVPRGNVQLMNPWRGLCIGGAKYMDAAITPRGAEITADDIDKCLLYEPEEVDLILSHDCPTGLGVPGAPGMEHYGEPGESRLAVLADHLHPRWWFFGHHHRWFEAHINGTHFVGLPESWLGYVLLHSSGEVEIVKCELDIALKPWWKRWPGFIS